jgi:hypothetical protein
MSGQWSVALMNVVDRRAVDEKDNPSGWVAGVNALCPVWVAAGFQGHLSVGVWESQASTLHALEVTKYVLEGGIVSGGRIMGVATEWSYNKGELRMRDVGEKSARPERWLIGGLVGQYVSISCLGRVLAIYMWCQWGVTIIEAISSEQVGNQGGVGNGNVIISIASDFHAQVFDAGTWK